MCVGFRISPLSVKWDTLHRLYYDRSAPPRAQRLSYLSFPAADIPGGITGHPSCNLLRGPFSAPGARGPVSMHRCCAMLMFLVAATALQSGLLSSVQQRRPSLAIAMRIRTPRRKGVSSRASKANGLSIQGGYGRAAPKSGAGKQALAEEAGTGKLGHVQVLLLKDCALGSAGAVMPMSLAEFRNVVERKGVGRLASPREVAEAAATPEGVVEYYATATAAAPVTATADAAPTDAPPATAQASSSG